MDAIAEIILKDVTTAVFVIDKKVYIVHHKNIGRRKLFIVEDNEEFLEDVKGLIDQKRAIIEDIKKKEISIDEFRTLLRKELK